MAATAEHAHPQPVSAPAPRYRLHPGMMGMYIFLCSEVMFFGAMFATYYYLFGSHPFGWPPAGTQPVHWEPLPFANTFVLFSSGVTCHFALDSLTHGGRSRHPWGALIQVVFLAGLLIAAGFGYRDGGEEGTFAMVLALAGFVVVAISLLPMLGLGPIDTGRKAFFGLLIATIVLGAGFEMGQGYEFLTAKVSFSGANNFGNAFFTMTGFHGAHVFGGLVLLTLVLGRALAGQFNAQNHVFVAAATLYWHFVDIVWIFLFGILYLAVTY